MGITTKDLAALCGVSRMTVHRALTDTGRINQQTKELILKTAKEHGYRPDLLARGLVKGQTFYIGVVVLDVNNRYFSQMLSAIETQARRQGYFVNITLHEKNKDMEREQLERLADYHVDGIILSSVNQGDGYKAFLDSLDTPLVSIGNRIADGVAFVGIQEREAAAAATDKICRAGYEKVVFVCPPLEDETQENIYVHRERAAGFRQCIQAFQASGREQELESEVIDRSDDYLERAYTILKQTQKRTAFFCTADMYALELMKYLKKRGLEPPRDYGLEGFDNTDVLQYVSPRLDTVYNSVEEVAGEAVSLLFDLMNGRETNTDRVLGYSLIDGETL